MPFLVYGEFQGASSFVLIDEGAVVDNLHACLEILAAVVVDDLDVGTFAVNCRGGDRPDGVALGASDVAVEFSEDFLVGNDNILIHKVYLEIHFVFVVVVFTDERLLGQSGDAHRHKVCCEYCLFHCNYLFLPANVPNLYQEIVFF